MVYELFKWTVVPPSVWMQNRIAVCIAIRSNFNLFWISIRIKNTLCALGIWYVMEFYIERWIWTRKWWFWARWPWCTAEYWYCMLQDIINETKKDMKNLHTIFFLIRMNFMPWCNFGYWTRWLAVSCVMFKHSHGMSSCCNQILSSAMIFWNSVSVHTIFKREFYLPKTQWEDFCHRKIIFTPNTLLIHFQCILSIQP